MSKFSGFVTFGKVEELVGYLASKARGIICRDGQVSIILSLIDGLEKARGSLSLTSRAPELNSARLCC